MDAPKVDRPPSATGEFFTHHLKPVWGVILFALVLTGIATVAELLLYRFLGQLLDWMTLGDPTTFFAQNASGLALMLVVAAIVRPVALLSSRATINLALAPGIANRTRLLNHRYVLRQSMGFFQKRLCWPGCAKGIANRQRTARGGDQCDRRCVDDGYLFVRHCVDVRRYSPRIIAAAGVLVCVVWSRHLLDGATSQGTFCCVV